LAIVKDLHRGFGDKQSENTQARGPCARNSWPFEFTINRLRLAFKDYQCAKFQAIMIRVFVLSCVLCVWVRMCLQPTYAHTHVVIVIAISAPPILRRIGAGAIELAGARRAPPQKKKIRQQGMGAQQNLWGTCNCTKRPQILGTPTYANMLWH